MDTASQNAMKSDDVLARIQDVFRAELDDDDLKVTMDTRAVDVMGWDSLAHIRLVSGIENEFDIQFSVAEIEQINSVRQFVDLVREHLQ